MLVSVSPIHSECWRYRQRPRCRKKFCFRRTSCSILLLLLPQTTNEKASEPSPLTPPIPSSTTHHSRSLPSRTSSTGSGRETGAEGAVLRRPTVTAPHREPRSLWSSCGGHCHCRRCLEPRGNHETPGRLSSSRRTWTSRRWRGCSRCLTGTAIWVGETRTWGGGGGRGRRGKGREVGENVRLSLA